VAGAGDVNGDGFSDLLVGAPGANGGDGAAYLFLGRASIPQTFPTGGLFGSSTGGALGTSVAGSGDFDGDGFADFVSGAPFSTVLKGFEDGSVHFGSPGQLQPDAMLHRPIDAFRPFADTPIGTGLRSDSPSAYRLRGRLRSPAGRARMRADVESRPVGTAFNGQSLLHGAWVKPANPTAGQPNTAPFALNVTGLAPNTKHHWRARTTTRAPWFGPSIWITPQANSRAQGDVRTAGGEQIVAVDPPSVAGARTLALAAARPNPARAGSTTTLAYVLPADGRMRLALHDAAGRHVRTLVERDAVAGPAAAAWDGRDAAGTAVAAGVYFARLEFGGESRESKVVVLP
jgi:hypothetical protein